MCNYPNIYSVTMFTTLLTTIGLTLFPLSWPLPNALETTIDVGIRGPIVGMKEVGSSYKEIAIHLGMAKSTFHNVVQHFKQTSSLESYRSCGLLIKHIHNVYYERCKNYIYKCDACTL